MARKARRKKLVWLSVMAKDKSKKKYGSLSQTDELKMANTEITFIQ